MKTIAIIPARGGSKGIPRKNIRLLAGKPLIAYSIEAALNTRELDRVVVSTEDNEIAMIAKKWGAEVMIRPEELAKDDVPTLPVLQHVLRELENKENYVPEIIVLLYATSPLLKPNRVSEAIKMLQTKKYDSVVGVVEDRGHYWIKKNGNYARLYPKELKNRQYTKPLFKENGALYACKREILMEKDELVGGRVGFLVMRRYENVDIDDPIDFKIVECIMEKGLQNEKD